jgi:hypothetical protein
MRSQQPNCRLMAIALSLLLTACGGGGGGSPAPAASTPAAAPTTSDPVPAQPGNNAAFTRCPDTPVVGTGGPSAGAALSGRVTFDRIPFFPDPPRFAAYGPGLDYLNPSVTPARGVIVEAVAASSGVCEGAVLDTAMTDGDGWYALNVDVDRMVCVRVRAQMYRAAGAGASWNLSVTDNTAGNSLYALADDRFASARSQPRRDLHAASGWVGGSYSQTRAAAPFAILDTACRAINTVIEVQPDAAFDAMQFRWSTRNTGSESGSLTEGKIGGAFYSPAARAVYLRGDASTDTDEFDEMVIAHEFAHFLSARFARSDSISGDHSLADKLDPRLAFDEGWATAFAGLALKSPVYRDSDEAGASREFYFYIDDASIWWRGWYAEASVQSVIYAVGESVNGDGVDLGFGSIWQVMRQSLPLTPSLQTLFSFGSALKENSPGAAGGIAQLLNAETVNGDAIEPFAATETHAPNPARDLPIYAILPIDNSVVRICSSNFYAANAVTDSPNKLSMQRLLRMDVPAAGTYRVSVTPELSTGLAGLKLLDQGSGFACDSSNSNIESLQNGSTVQLTCALQSRTYVAVVYQTDFSNDSGAQAGNYDQCFSVRAAVVTQ